MGFLDKILTMFKKESPIEGSIDAGPVITGGSADGAEIVSDQVKSTNLPEQSKGEVVDMTGDPVITDQASVEIDSAKIDLEPTVVEPEVIAKQPADPAGAEINPTGAEAEPLEKMKEVKQAPISNPATSIEELEAKIGTGAEPEIMAQEGGPEEMDKPEE